ncbi:MAG: SHD1 domain-containing protein [Planctomycetota bacterium]
MSSLLKQTSLTLLAFLALQTQLDARTWTDSTGAFTLEAEFVNLELNTVVLRKPDGTIVKLQMTRLSAPDQAYVRAMVVHGPPSQGPENPKGGTSGYTTREPLKPTETTNLPGDGKPAESRAPPSKPDPKSASDWRERERGWIARLRSLSPEAGGALSPQQATVLARLQDELAGRTYSQLTTRKADEDTLRALHDLTKKDGSDIRSEFHLGLLSAVCLQDWPEARRCFTVCARVRPEHPPSLNNMALVHVRHAEWTAALRSWDRAIKLAPDSHAIHANVRRMLDLIESDKLSLPQNERERLREIPLNKDPALPVLSAGWVYMSYFDETPEWPDEAARARHGFLDAWCNGCNGAGKLKCPNPDCHNGTVLGDRRVSIGAGNLRVPFTRKGRSPCAICKGTEFIPCPACKEGIDPKAGIVAQR